MRELQSVSVRLTFGHRTHRVALVGLERGATLRRLVGMHGEVTELPPGGIVLSTKLAQTLGVAAGDFVEVEALVAPRSIEAMQVTALTDEMVGLGALLHPSDQLRDGVRVRARSSSLR